MSATEPLCLVGSATIAQISDHHDRLRTALTSANDSLALDMSGIEQADVTLVQLILSASAGAGLPKRDIAVVAWSPAASGAFARAGVAPESLALVPSIAD